MNGSSLSADTPDRDVVRFTGRLPNILTLTGIFFLNFLARFIWGPLLPTVEADLNIRHTAAGSLFMMISGGYFVGLLVSGHLSSRFNHQITVVLSCLTCAAALVIATAATSLNGLRAALMVLGLTGGIYLPSGIASLTYRLAPTDFGKALAFHETSPSLGFIVGPLLAELLLGYDGWRGVLWPVVSGLCLAAWIYVRRDWSGNDRGEAPTLANMHRVLARPTFWWMLVPFMFAVAANIGVYSMLPLFLQAGRGVDRASANLLLSASRLAAIAAPLLSGWATDRFGPRPVAGTTIVAGGVATVMLALVSDRWLWLPMGIQSMMATAFFPAGFAILIAIVVPRDRSLMVSLVMPLSIVVGGGLIPTFIGLLADAGRFNTAFALVGLFITVSAVFLWRIGARGKHR